MQPTSTSTASDTTTWPTFWRPAPSSNARTSKHTANTVRSASSSTSTTRCSRPWRRAHHLTRASSHRPHTAGRHRKSRWKRCREDRVTGRRKTQPRTSWRIFNGMLQYRRHSRNCILPARIKGRVMGPEAARQAASTQGEKRDGERLR